jgi:U32 family peptidase
MSVAFPSRAVELLSPAGDRACLEAALEAGADAVYFGLREGYNARSRAENFSRVELSSVMQRIHERARRGYLTLNTLVFDAEWDELTELLDAAADAGVDAVIVQDLGLARAVAARYRSLPIHASTQMTVSDPDALALVAELGVRRVVLPRELSLTELAELRAATDCALEVFVHGAMCVGVSGQCRVSESVSERSANRGQCAQPCRLPYTLLVDGLPTRTEGTHLLSPKDLDASSLVGELLAIGIDAFKIEGRQKSPEYVRAATHLYRTALDAALAGCPRDLEREKTFVHQIFSRGKSLGFLSGSQHSSLVEARSCDHIGLRLGEYRSTVYEGPRTWLVLKTELELALGDGIVVGPTSAGHEAGGRIWGMLLEGKPVKSAPPVERVLVWLGPESDPNGLVAGSEVRRTSCPGIERELFAATTGTRPRLLVAATLTGQLGEEPRLRLVTASGHAVEVVVPSVLLPAREHGLNEALVADKLGRLGDTPYRLGQVNLELPPGTTLATSALNQARREAVRLLLAEYHPSHQRSPEAPKVLSPRRSPPPCGIFATCATEAQARAALEAGAHGVYLDLRALDQRLQLLAALRAEGHEGLGVTTPHFATPAEVGIEERLLAAQPELVLVRSLGSLARLRRAAPSATLVGDVPLNVTNRHTAELVLGLGLDAFTLAPEQRELALEPGLSARVERVIYGHPFVMVTAHCLFAAHLSHADHCGKCSRPCEDHDLMLKDPKGRRLFVRPENAGKNLLYGELVERAWRPVQGGARWRVDFLDEGADAVRHRISALRKLLDEGARA